MRRHQESLIVNVDVVNNNVNDVNVLSLWRNITIQINNAQVKKSMKMVEEASNCKSCIKVGFKDGIIFLKKRSRWVLETNTEEILLNLSCASCTLFFSIKICSEDNDSLLEEELIIFQIHYTGGEEDGGWRSAERRIHHQLILAEPRRSNMIRWKYTKVYHLCFVGMNCWDFGKWRMLTEWLDVTSLVWRRSIVVLCTSCGPIEHIGLTQTVCDDECMGFLLFLSKKN